ncbi:GNAT family N-acetyltransferase [Georgenia sp. EYE_87]|uniref:GNAT family N-acetyltransferase n=1 Tax=Georgenia sp. EYE_87 TaxID=2853448 RepID=UPI002005A968|nr:GNAT family N-acetyltransferase [Georgenia sp. EYE_87]MCK6209306.1 GNAT family N-acetyltransferase [Georgenia sp. EYE_87]
MEDAPYPAEWEADVVLRDGAAMHIRPIRPDDADALQRMHLAQSAQSVYFRFFAPMARLSDKDLHRFTHVDHRSRVALVLTEGDEIRAVGRFDVVDPGTAEVAFYVADTEQGRGLGSVLLEHLAAAGRERGVHTFVADVLPGNAKMIRVFSDAGYEVRQQMDDGVVSVAFDIEETERSWRVMAERERHAEALSMRTVLAATSLVLVRLGPDGGEGDVLASAAARSLLVGGFRGPVHLVGLDGVGHAEGTAPAHGTDQADGTAAADAADPGAGGRVRRYPDLGAVEGPVELAVVAGPSEQVVDAVPALAALGVRAVVVLSHGFGEQGPEGMHRQRRLLRRTREAGMRVVGPASYGVVGNGEAGRYNASLWTESTGPEPGTPGPLAVASASRGIGMFCQSAAAALALRSTAARRRLPVSSFLSSGLRVDVSGNDTMQFWSVHEPTAVGAVYLESIGNPRKFSRIARRLSATTPLVAVVSGQTGQATPPGHAVRTSTQPQRVLTEMLRQAGVVRARTQREMLDVAGLLLAQPLPAGPRTAVVSSSASLAALVADVAAAQGLEVAGRPVTLEPLAGPDAYEAALAALRGRDDWDAVVIALAPPLGRTDPGVAAAIARAAAQDPRTWVASAHGLHGLTEELTADGACVPSMTTVEDAVGALAGAVRHASWREHAGDPLVDPPGIDPVAAREVLAETLGSLPPGRRERLDQDTAARLLACYGIEVLGSTTVTDPDAAVEAAERIGWPVALKTTDEVLRHRTDLGGVRLDLTDADALREAMVLMAERTREVLGRSSSFEVQAMAPPGVACVVRGAEDDLYGPVVSFGLGGDATELLGDVSHRITPLTATDVSDMVRSVRAAPRLLGHRGLPVVDLAALEDVIARVSMLTDDLTEVVDVTLNPVIVGERGARITSFSVEVAHPVRQDAGRRALPIPPEEGEERAGVGE